MSRRKYERYFNPISRESFSTAGTHRNQGRVGQTSLSRSLVRTTRIPGTALPTGNGGTCGKYPVNIVNSCCKGSHSDGQTSMTTKGLLLSRVRNPTGVYNTACAEPGACNKPTVKNFDPAIHSNETLLRRLRAKNMQQNWPNLDGRSALPVCGEEGYIYNCNSCGPGGAPPSHYIGTRKFTNEPYAKRVAPMDIGEYLRTQYLYKNPTENCCKKGESGAIIPDELNPVGGGNQDDVPIDDTFNVNDEDVPGQSGDGTNTGQTGGISLAQWLSENQY